MKKKSLTEFDAAALTEIIKGLGRSPGRQPGPVIKQRLFYNEAQFQFALAWAIQEQYDCEPLLEPLSRVVAKKPKGIKREYTDIVLVEKDGPCIAIELKYKTAGLEINNGTSLTQQGAPDLAVYDFYHDIDRIQNLTGLAENEEGAKLFFQCDRGYAVFLTNDSTYWTESKSKDACIHRDFLIAPSESEGIVRITDVVHDWNPKKGETDKPKTVKGTFRERPISIKKELTSRWEELYTLSSSTAGNPRFRFLVMEIPPRSK